MGVTMGPVGLRPLRLGPTPFGLIGDLKVDWSISEISRVALLVALRVALAL